MNPDQLNANPKISLVSIHTGPSPQAVPLASAFLKSAAQSTTADVILIDFFTGQQPAECALAISETLPDAVGFSIYAWNRELCLNIAAQLRTCLPDARLFAGGPEVTADPENILKAGTFDFIICGEGELPFTAFCRRMASKRELKGIPGLLLPGDNPISFPAPPADPDQIPSPYLTGVLDVQHYSGILWQLSRGCGFSCDFCFDSRGLSGVRRFSLKRVEAELSLFASKGVSQVFVLDSTFNQDVKRAKAILRMIRKTAPRIHFHFEVRSEFIDREMAGLFAKLTCSLQIGLQSSDSAVLKQVGRAFDKNDFRSRVQLLNDSGAIFGFDLMYGLPGDTLQGFYNSLDFALSLYPNHLDIFPLAVLPGTALHLKCRDLGLEYLPAPPYTLIASSTFSIDDIQKATQIATACDIFYTRGKAVAWFNGVIAVLRIKPSDFLRLFGEMLMAQKESGFNESDLDDVDIWNLQRKFLIQTFDTRRLKRFQPLVLDLADYHYHYAAALLAPQTKTSNNPGLKHKILESPLRRSRSLQMAHFHYDINDIIEAGAPDICWMSDHLEPFGSYAAIYPHGDSVCTESFDESYYKLLEALNGRTNAGILASQLGIPKDDASDFLQFGLKEGFVVP